MKKLMSPSTPEPFAKEHYRRALQKVEELHGNMAVLAKLGRLLRETDSSLDDVARLLLTDSALCASVIRLSNSVHFGFGARNLTINDALVRVGFSRVLGLIGTALSKRLFMRDLKAYGVTADEYWSYSYFTATMLETQASRLCQAADEAYLLGLLHALGRVVINDLLAQTRIEIYWDNAIPCEEWEDAIVGFRYDEAAAHLLQRWKFPPSLCSRVAHHRSLEARAADPLLLFLDYARACSELNHFNLENAAWRLPENHPWTLRPDFDPDQAAIDIESAKMTCLHLREAIKMT